MLVLNANHIKMVLLALICIFALTAGFFVAQLTGFLIQPPPDDSSVSPRAITDRAVPQASLDTESIIQRNIFDPTARGRDPEPEVEAEVPREPVRTVVAGDLKLFGTVDGGETPLALIKSAGEVKIYHVDDEIPGGGELISVERNEVLIRQADGSQMKLVIVKPELTTSSPSSTTATSPVGSGVQSLGDNRWSVSRDEVERARNNLNQLLKSARMEPNIEYGKTEGFIVKMVRPRSLLAQLGIRRGDVVKRVNGVELNSPEKALQIFQQLREAKRLTVDLKRGRENLSFEYEVN